MKQQIKLTGAELWDAEALTAVAVRAKAHWGYSAEFMAACRDELSVSVAVIGDPRNATGVAREATRPVGFYLARPLDDGVWDLDALFVEPEYIGTGIGCMLFRDAVEVARSRCVERIVIQSDPNAEGFYLAMGAVKTGEKESGSIAGRYLPLLELKLSI